MKSRLPSEGCLKKNVLEKLGFVVSCTLVVGGRTVALEKRILSFQPALEVTNS